MKLIYRPEIDGLRAIAIGVVIIYHAGINILDYQLFKGGFIGVDIFFVISGYLITSIILKELISTGSFSFRYFYERRIRRILPPLLIIMLISIPFGWLFLLPSSLIDFSKSILFSLGFSSNYYFHYSGQQYGAESGLLKPFLHTWSLSIEEQYYIIFPLVLFVTFKFFRKYLIYILLLCFFISLGIADWTAKNYPSTSFYFLHTRMWELLAGSILAYFEISSGYRSKNKILNSFLPLIGLLLIGHSILFFHDEMLHPSFYTLSPILGVSLIIWFSNKDEIITKMLSTKLFVGIGLISYSLYLWHYPIFAFYRYTFAQGSIILEIIIIIVLFLISSISYFFLEKNFRNPKFKFKKILIIFFILIIFIFSTCYFTIYKRGFPNKGIVDGINLDYNYYVEEISDWQKEISSKKKIKSVNEKKKTIIVIGDSLANNFALMFRTNLDLFPNLKFVTLNIDEFNQILNNVDSDSELNLLIKESNNIIFSYQYSEDEYKKVESTIKLILKKTNKNIILTSNNPAFNLYGSRFTDIDFFLISKKRKPSKEELIELEKRYFSYYKNNNPSIMRIDKKLKNLSRKYDLEYLDKSLYQCDEIRKQCKILTDENKKINYDSHHHTLAGAKYLGQKIFKLNWLKLN